MIGMSTQNALNGFWKPAAKVAGTILLVLFAAGLGVTGTTALIVLDHEKRVSAVEATQTQILSSLQRIEAKLP